MKSCIYILKQFNVIYFIMQSIFDYSLQNCVLSCIKLVDKNNCILNNVRVAKHIGRLNNSRVSAKEFIHTHQQDLPVLREYRRIQFSQPLPILILFYGINSLFHCSVIFLKIFRHQSAKSWFGLLPEIFLNTG